LENYNKDFIQSDKEIQFLLRKASDSFKENKLENAISYCNKILRRDPKNKYALDLKAMSFSTLEIFDEALFCFDQSLQIDSQNYFALYGKATVYSKMGDFENAVKYCNICLTMKKDSSIYDVKGNALTNLERHKEARECFEKAIKLDPDDNPLEWQKQ